MVLFSLFFLACNPVICRADMGGILNQWRHLVASVVALEPLHYEMCTVSYQSISSAVEMGQTEMHLFVANDFTFNLIVAY
jgi:hypothetical protein